MIKDMKIKKIYTMLLASIALTACQPENLSDPVKGAFSISLTEATAEVETKATPADLDKPVAEKFNLLITNKTTGKELYKGAFTDQTIPASVGTYTVKATCSPNTSYEENPVLALDAPYYEGTEEATLTADKTVSVTIPCHVANALASIRFGNNKDKFEALFSSYVVEVKVGNSSVSLQDTLRSAYYRAGSDVKFFFKGKLKGNGQDVTKELTHSEFSKAETFVAGAHCVINLSVEKTTSGVILTVAAAEVKKETINATIPMEWLPKPKIAGFANGETSLYYVETADAIPAKITFNASSKIQDVEFSFNFQDEQYLSFNDKTYTLTTLSDEDKAAFTKASIIIPVLDGSAEGSMDFTSMTANLQTNAGAETVNTIKLRVKANNRWSDQGTYEIRTQKPIFRVSAYPGNIWTKEFTMNALMEDQVETGNFNKLAEDMTYQYKSEQSNWETLGTDLRKTGLQPGTMYYIRGLYRGEVEGEVLPIKTYETLTIPNSSLDEGYATTYPKSKNPLYSFDGGWIGTRNPLTCHADGANAFYVSKSSVLPITDNNSTVAHMMTIGWGSGNTCSFGNKSGSVINHISAGLVCVGDYDAGKDFIYPKEAYIRPTSLSFTYKASPYNNDEYQIAIYLISMTEEGQEIIVGSGIMQSGESVGSYKTETLPITYDDTYKETVISHIRVIFKSGTKEDRDHLEDKFTKEGSGSFYSNYYIRGSQFWLDSFVLNYEK